MMRRYSVRVGDLQTVDDAPSSGLTAILARAPSWLVVAASCLTTLTLLSVGAGIWLPRLEDPPGGTGAERRAAGRPAPVGPPATFPDWIEIPHLSRSAQDDGFTASARDEASRPSPASRPDPAERRDPAPAQGVVEEFAEAVTHPGQASSSIAMAPTAIAPPAATPDLSRGRTLLAPTVVATQPPDGASVVGPATTVSARSAAPPARATLRTRAAFDARRAAGRTEDADETASIATRTRPGHPRIDAGAVARASVHRIRPGTASDPQARAPAASWTLPPALAPTP